MRKNLEKLILRLSCVALVATCTGSMRAEAHDFPDPNVAHSHVSDCLGFRETADVEPYPCIAEQPANVAAAVLVAGRRQPVGQQPSSLDFQLRLDALASLSGCLAKGRTLPLVAAKPDEGVPPGPHVFSNHASAERSRVKAAFIEDHQPYDFCVRDKRYAPYSYRELSRVAHSDFDPQALGEETQLDPVELRTGWEPELVAAMLDQAITRVNSASWQIQMELSEMHAAQDVGRLTYKMNQRTSNLLGDALVTWTEHVSNTQDSTQLAVQPYHTEPLYILYDQEGYQFLLPIEPEDQPQDADHSPAGEAPLVAEAGRLRAQVLTIASQQFEKMGTSLLKLSSVLDSIAAAEIARGNSSPLR